MICYYRLIIEDLLLKICYRRFVFKFRFEIWRRPHELSHLPVKYSILNFQFFTHMFNQIDILAIAHKMAAPAATCQPSTTRAPPPNDRAPPCRAPWSGNKKANISNSKCNNPKCRMQDAKLQDSKVQACTMANGKMQHEDKTIQADGCPKPCPWIC